MKLVSDIFNSNRHSHGGWRFAIIVLLGSMGCRGGSIDEARAKTISIAAASDLRNACPKLVEQFERQTGIKVTTSFGASGQIAAQITQGAPFDLFLAANQSFVEDLVVQGLIEPESLRPYARGSLVLAVYHEYADEVRSLDDLTKPNVKKIALANPDTAPYGKAGKQVLERKRLFKQLEPKIVLAESVSQAMIYVQKGDAEAALIGKAIAGAPEIRVVEIDADLYNPIIQALGIVTTSTRKVEANAFADFILGEEGQSILAEFGFAKPPAPASGTEPLGPTENR